MALIHTSDKFGAVNLDTIAGLQAALKHLGHDPGTMDGIDGPNTRSAVKAFQLAAGVGADGLAGPVTKKALAVALDHAATPEGSTEQAMAAAADAVKGMLG